MKKTAQLSPSIRPQKTAAKPVLPKCQITSSRMPVKSKSSGLPSANCATKSSHRNFYQWEFQDPIYGKYSNQSVPDMAIDSREIEKIHHQTSHSQANSADGFTLRKFDPVPRRCNGNIYVCMGYGILYTYIHLYIYIYIHTYTRLSKFHDLYVIVCINYVCVCYYMMCFCRKFRFR